MAHHQTVWNLKTIERLFHSRSALNDKTIQIKKRSNLILDASFYSSKTIKLKLLIDLFIEIANPFCYTIVVNS